MSATLVAFDLSGFLALPNSTRLKYQQYWTTYNRIQTINSNVSTLRAGGDKSKEYYNFVSYVEQNQFLNGQMLHIRRYPDSNWAPVSKD